MQVQVTNTLTPYLTELRKLVSDRRIDEAIGQGAALAVRNHLTARNTIPNKLGGKRTNFYAAAAKSVNVQLGTPGTSIVSINKLGLRQRWQGGWIRPRAGKKYLTIPAIAEAHGRRASEFANLRFGFAEGKSGNLVPALVEASSTQVKFGRKRKDGTRKTSVTGTSGGRAVFYLVRQVFQQADPTVLPTQDVLAQAGAEAGRNLLAAGIARKGKP